MKRRSIDKTSESARKWVVLILVAIGLFSTLVHAEETPTDKDSFIQYNAIVSQLKSNLGEPVEIQPQRPKLHVNAGLALVGSYLSVVTPEGVSGTGLLKGFEGHAGLDLFGSELSLDAAFRIYASDALSNRLNADLKELELNVIYLADLQNGNQLRIGGGLSTRFLDIESNAYGRAYNLSYTTPSLVFLMGFEKRLSPNLSVGPDIAYRNTMVRDTIDKSSVDGSMNLTAHF